MIQSELAMFIVPGVFFIMLLGLTMQFLRSKDMKETGLTPYSGMINVMLMIAMLILFLIFAMMIVGNFAI